MMILKILKLSQKMKQTWHAKKATRRPPMLSRWMSMTEVGERKRLKKCIKRKLHWNIFCFVLIHTVSTFISVQCKTRLVRILPSISPLLLLCIVTLMNEFSVGSTEHVTQPMFVLDKEKGKIVEKEITFTPGLYKIFDEYVFACRCLSHFGATLHCF